MVPNRLLYLSYGEEVQNRVASPRTHCNAAVNGSQYVGVICEISFHVYPERHPVI
jgi:hypothetical protein